MRGRILPHVGHIVDKVLFKADKDLSIWDNLLLFIVCEGIEHQAHFAFQLILSKLVTVCIIEK